jgi:hypothetical protein
MAVRNFDLTETRPPRLMVLNPAPVGRRELRRTKQRYAFAGVFALLAPFVAALCVLGVSR